MKTKVLPISAKFLTPAFLLAFSVIPVHAQAQEIVVLPGVVGPVGELDGVTTQGPGLLTVGNQNINTNGINAAGITTDAANTANILFSGTSTVTGFTGTVGSTFLNISAGANASTVTFNDQVFSTTFSVSGTGTVNFNGGFVSNTGSTVDFAGDGFINLGANQTLVGAITNSAGANTGTLTLGSNSILDGAVGAASGLKLISLSGGDALITGQANAQTYTLGTNTLNITGAMQTPVAGTINTTIFSTTDFGQIVPVGAATIGDALAVNVNVTGDAGDGNIFNIVDATSGTTGSTVIVTDNSLLFDFSATPTAAGLVQITSIKLDVDPIIGALSLTSPLQPLLGALPQAELANAIAQLNPGTAGLYAAQEGYRLSQQFQNTWASHLEETWGVCGRDAPAADARNKNQYQQDDFAACESRYEKPNLWLEGFGSFSEQDNKKGFEGYDSRTWGAILGVDVPVSRDIRLGVGVGYAQTELDGNTFDTDTDIDSYQATAYLGYMPGQWFANAALSYGFNNYTSSRRVVFTGVDERVSASYDGRQYTAFGTTGYHFYAASSPRTVITPNASLQYTHLDIDNYTETAGSSVALNVDDQDYNFVQSSLGVKIAHDVSLSGTKILRPEIHANWLHSFNNERAKSTASFNDGGEAFTTRGLRPERATWDAGASILLASENIWSLEGLYSYKWNGNGYNANQVGVKFSIRL